MNKNNGGPAIIEGYISDVNPIIWGPKKWKDLHCMSLTYPNEPMSPDMFYMIDYINRIPVILPCEICRKHSKEYLDSHCLDIVDAVKSKYNLFAFFVHFHNEVNKRTNKPIYTVDDALRIWAPCAAQHG